MGTFSLLASPSAKYQLSRLFAVGATVGPLIDGIHNQALLKYDAFPLILGAEILKTSYLIPPLLGITYAVLGGIIPLLGGFLINEQNDNSSQNENKHDDVLINKAKLRSIWMKAIVAVLTTASIITLSNELTLGTISVPDEFSASILRLFGNVENLPQLYLYLLGFIQWMLQDRNWRTLLAAMLVSVFGPLAEIPFISCGAWHYIHPDYFPFGKDLPGLASITGPCYFAVMLDATALGRAFFLEHHYQSKSEF
jgi:hypothetical protein